jgi:HEAT repeat protein
MDKNLFVLDTLQPQLFNFEEGAIGTLELFPAVWGACEDLVSPETLARSRGLDRLLELGAPRLSPLVAYLLVTRLAEPDVSVRRRIVHALGALFSPDERGLSAPDAVRRVVGSVLSLERTTSVYGLLEVACSDPEEEQLRLDIAHLLNSCPYAGQYLAEIMGERKYPLDIRYQAVYYIGRVGYLDAIQALERLAVRLEARLTGQQAMPFAPPVLQDEVELLPAIRIALSALRAP